jgi:hypothetical protein
MHFRLLLQLLWVAKLDWDEPIPKDIQLKFMSSIANLSVMNTLKIPKWMGYRGANWVFLCIIASFFPEPREMVSISFA